MIINVYLFWDVVLRWLELDVLFLVLQNVTCYMLVPVQEFAVKIDKRVLILPNTRTNKILLILKVSTLHVLCHFTLVFSRIINYF